jgi:glycosyltransferase involved in cell wall biosynthesis
MKTLARIANSAVRTLWLARNRSAFRDEGASRRPRLLVDVSVIMRHDAATGIQRVVRSVWAELARTRSSDFDVVPVYAGSRQGYCFAPADFLSRKAKPASVPVGVRAGDKFLGLDLSAHYVPDYCDQLAAWRANGASLHFVVYDLLPLSRPEWFEQSTCDHFQRWMNSVLTHADQALCISDSVAQEFRRRTIGSSAHQRLRVGRLQLSGDIAASLPSSGCQPFVQSTLHRLGSKRTVLMVGTIEPRKGYDRAIDAFERLWSAVSDAPDLVIVGKPGWKTSGLQQRIRNHPEYGQRLHWLEDVSDEGLTAFYAASAAVFLASYDEGFGLPAVEAAMHRRWALVRDLPVFREKQLPNLRFFADDRPETLAAELRAILHLAERHSPPVSTAPKWSWCVERLLEEIGAASSRAPLLRAVS